MTILRSCLLTLSLTLLIVGCDSAPDTADQTGETVAEDSDVRLFPASRDGRWGFIDASGSVVIEPSFDWAGEFTDGLALIRQDGVYGYVRRNGEVAIEPQFEDAWHFSEGLAPVQMDNQWGYIDETGEIVVDPQFDLVPSVLEERDVSDPALRPTRNGDGYGYRGEEGNMDIAARFENAWYFSGGLARVRIDGQWGYIDRQGEVVIEPRFDRAWDFRDDIAMVDVGGEIGYIDREGDYVWEPGQ